MFKAKRTFNAGHFARQMALSPLSSIVLWVISKCYK
jgi:hypothetical protein